MLGKSTGSRIVLLTIAIILLLILWAYGVSSEIMIGAIILVVIRIIALAIKMSSNDSGDKPDEAN